MVRCSAATAFLVSKFQGEIFKYFRCLRKMLQCYAGLTFQLPELIIC
jgi:hypothetical protein